MNQKEIWLVVNPTVGLPLFLGAVAATSLIVHAAVLTNSDWYPAYLNGNQKAPVAAAPAATNAAPVASVAAPASTMVATTASP